MCHNYNWPTLPACLGGMHINDPVHCAGIAFSTSKKMIVDATMSLEEFCVCIHINQMREAKKEQKPALSTSQQGTLKSILTSLSSDKKHVVQRAVVNN